MKNILMPQFGETVEEPITIVRWLRKPGEPVTVGEILAEVETDKSTLEIEATSSGRLVRILIEAGRSAKPGTILATIEEAS